jgi:uncharacterized delta-60 repeat protein
VLTLSTDKALVIQGRSVDVTATVQRTNGFAGAVQVALQGLPDGVSAPPVTIPADATSAVVTLHADIAAPHSLPTAATATGTSGNATVTRPLTVTAGGLPGAVDTSFNGGTQRVPVSEGESYATAMAVQADGKVVTVGMTSTIAGGTDIAVVRHLRDGTLDAGFGNGGKVVTSVGPGRASDEAYAVAVQPDGRIVVAGATDNGASKLDFALVRYLPDGALDTGFGSGGKVVTTFGADTDRAYALVLQADGKIVVGGDTYSGAATGVDFALARYNADGTLDGGFGNGGTVVSAIRQHAARESVYALALQPVAGETRIVAVGGEGDFVAARYTASGQLDTSFGHGGALAGIFGNASIGAARAVVAVPGEQLVLAGHVGHDFSLVRLNADGTLDAGFGTGGKVTTAVSTTNWDEATALVRQADGKLVAGGWVYEGNSSSGNFAVVRYEADGTLDATFGNGGQAIAPAAAATRSDSGRALALQVDERISTVRVLQAGEASEGGFRFALQRYWL